MVNWRESRFACEVRLLKQPQVSDLVATANDETIDFGRCRAIGQSKARSE